MIADGATALISCGLAGGLDPTLAPGSVVIPEAVVTGTHPLRTDTTLSKRLGGPAPHTLLATTRVVATAAEKQRLWQQTGCAALDMESGAVAEVATERGLPFAVLRAVCDPAWRSVPPAALAALDSRGTIAFGRVAASLARQPGQFPGLLSLIRDATQARRSLLHHLACLPMDHSRTASA